MRGSKLSFFQRVALERHRRDHIQAAREHRLHTLFWECTLRCNLRCRHCGSDCRAEAEAEELSGAQFLSVVDSLTPHVDPHKVLIIFTGGEALLRKDLEEIGLELYRREYPWGIVTNGMLLNEARLERLQQAGLHTLTISLDGFEQAHNYLRGHPESFQRASKAVELLAKTQEIVWDVVTCVNPMNFDYLPRFRDFLLGLGLRNWRLFTIFPVGRAAEDPHLQLDDAQFVQLMDFIAETNNSRQMVCSYGCEGFLGGYEGVARQGFYSCHAGIGVASILCDGTISACPSIRFDYRQGSILQDDFWQVWQERFIPYRDRSWARRDQCADCSVWRYCEGNGMHLHDDEGKLLVCHYQRIKRGERLLKVKS